MTEIRTNLKAEFSIFETLDEVEDVAKNLLIKIDEARKSTRTNKYHKVPAEKIKNIEKEFSKLLDCFEIEGFNDY